MSFSESHTVRRLLESIDKGTYAAVNLYSSMDESLEAVAKDLEKRLSPNTVTLDVSAYASFEELIRDLIMQLLLRADKPEDCHVEDRAIEEQSMKLLRRFLNRLLSAFDGQDSWICLILKHFESADSYWEDGACAWVRELVDSGKIHACVILSSAPISSVCEKPVGSSPLYNIFRSYSLEGRE